MKHVNSINIAGTVKWTDYYDGGEFGFLKLQLGTIRLSISNRPSNSMLELAKSSQGAVVVDANMAMDKKGMFNVTGSDSRVLFCPYPLAPWNSGTVCGKVEQITIDQKGIYWAVLACEYMGRAGSTKITKDRKVLVKLDKQWGEEYKGRQMWVCGVLNPKDGDEWRLHIEAINSVVF